MARSASHISVLESIKKCCILLGRTIETDFPKVITNITSKYENVDRWLDEWMGRYLQREIGRSNCN